MKQPTQRTRPGFGPRDWARWVVYGLIIIAGVMSFIVVGMNGLAWTSEAGSIRLWLRAGLGAVVTFCFVCFMWTWGRIHSKSTTRLTEPEQAHLFPQFESWDADGTALHEQSLNWSALTRADALLLSEHLLRPRALRHRIREVVQLTVHQSVHSVSILWADPTDERPSVFIHIGNRQLVPIMRRDKSLADRPGELQIEGAELLSSTNTAALLYHVVSLLLGLPTSGTIDDEHVETRSEIARIILRPWSEHQALSTDLIAHMQGVAGGDVLDLVNDLITDLSLRRPYIATMPRDDVSAASKPLVFSYRSALNPPTPTPDYDPWRKAKDAARSSLTQGASRFKHLPLGRARTTTHYEMLVSCDDRLYFEEVEVWSPQRRRWLASLSPLKQYRSFIHWTRPNGTAFAWFGSANLGGAPETKSLALTVRLAEKPPGLLGGATFTALAAMVAVWAGGIVSQHAPAGAVTLITFLLSAPAIAGSFFELKSSGAERVLRSLTASTSLVLSMIISLSTVVYFLLRVSRGLEYSWRIFPDAHRFFLLDDIVWSALFAISAINFSIVGGTLWLRLRRYLTLVAGSHTTPKADPVAS